MRDITLNELRSHTGEEIAVSDWVTISQERIDQFAEATDDRQWLHVDVERAPRESPYGATVAHGFLTLSLIGSLLRNAVAIGGAKMTINYGLNRVRFAAPVPAGAAIRGRFTLAAILGHPHGTKVVWDVVVEREADAKTCCAAEWIVLYSPAI